MLKRTYFSLVLCLFGAVILSGCDTEQLPDNSTLSITPPERSFEITERRDADDRCVFDVGDFVDVPVLLKLRDGKGSPIGGVDVSVYVDFAANSFSRTAPLALYEDRNGNGIVDADAEIVSGEGADIARVKLDRISGSQAVLMRVNISCAYRSEIIAFVDGTSASASVEVIARDIVAPTPAPAGEPVEPDTGLDA